MTIPTAPPSGFRDFSPEACALRARAAETISRVYRSFGFQLIGTSAVEDLKVLLGKEGGENEKLIFKIMKRGEALERAQAAGEELADLGLRFDLTLPLARYYSKYGSQLPHPFKAFNLGPVWRAERAQKGRYREFWQCDADIVGSDALTAEVDVISAILAAFEAFSLEVSVVLNDRGLLLKALESLGVPQDKIPEVCVELDKIDKLPEDAIMENLERLGAKAAWQIGKLGIEDLRKIDGAAVDRLHGIQSLVNTAFRREAVRFDQYLVRGFGYYTGPVFEFRHPKFGGSIGGGGRYDRLTEKFGGPAVPAVGGSIGFERLLLLLEEEGKTAATGPEYVVTIFSEELRDRALEIAGRLRAAGRTVDTYPGSGKLKQQFKYADAKKAARALVMGPDEAAKGEVKVKDLKTGEERSVKVEDLLR